MRFSTDQPGHGRKLYCALALLASALGAIVTAPAHAAAPFVDNGDGTVTD